MNVIFRTARALLALLALSCAAAGAQAQILNYLPAGPYRLLPAANETATYIKVDYYNNAGELVHVQGCGTNGCGPGYMGAAKTVASIQFNQVREEIVSDSCNGAPTVVQGSCTNGVLSVSMRLRTGVLIVKHVAEGGQPLLQVAGSPRFEFLDNSRIFLGLPNSQNRVGNGLAFPAGMYKVTAPDLAGHCLPVVTNNGQTINVDTTGETTVEIRYRGTECELLVQVDKRVPDLQMFSDTGRLDCSTPPNTAFNTSCLGRVKFNQQTRITALLPAGFEPYFGYVNNRCDYLPLDRTTCTFKPTLDTYISMLVRPLNGPPPPAEPVGLEMAAGTSSPADAAATKGDGAVAMLQLRATPRNGNVSVQALTLQTSGSGRDDLDLTSIRLVADANGNGRADAGEAVLAQGRAVADNGSMRLVLATPLTLSTGTDLIVVADIATEVHTASAAIWGGAGTVLAFGLVAWPSSRRRIVAGVAIAAMAAVLVSACGGGDGEGEGTDPSTVVDTTPPVPPTPPVLLTYRLDLTAVEATDTAAPGTALPIYALPIRGATYTVVQ